MAVLKDYNAPKPEEVTNMGKNPNEQKKEPDFVDKMIEARAKAKLQKAQEKIFDEGGGESLQTSIVTKAMVVQGSVYGECRRQPPQDVRRRNTRCSTLSVRTLQRTDGSPAPCQWHS